MRIGDRVKVKNKLSSYFGIMGTIEEYCGGGFHVKLDDNEEMYFTEYELEVIIPVELARIRI